MKKLSFIAQENVILRNENKALKAEIERLRAQIAYGYEAAAAKHRVTTELRKAHGKPLEARTDVLKGKPCVTVAEKNKRAVRG